MKIRAFLPLTLFCCSISAHALDTVEPLGPGLSDLEAYVSGSDGEYATDLVVGAGYGAYLNPLLGATFSSAPAAFSVSNISNLYTGIVDFDVVPSVTISDGNLSYAVDTELTHALGDRFVPYVQTNYAFTTEGEYADALTVNLGTVYKVQEGQELLVQASVLVDDTSSWGAAIGYNFLVHDEIEAIAELSTSDDQMAFALGAIWSF
jgi:hypothetical protein